MRLILADHQILTMRLGDATRLDGADLVIDGEGLRKHLLEDPPPYPEPVWKHIGRICVSDDRKEQVNRLNT